MEMGITREMVCFVQSEKLQKLNASRMPSLAASGHRFHLPCRAELLPSRLPFLLPPTWTSHPQPRSLSPSPPTPSSNTPAIEHNHHNASPQAYAPNIHTSGKSPTQHQTRIRRAKNTTTIFNGFKKRRRPRTRRCLRPTVRLALGREAGREVRERGVGECVVLWVFWEFGFWGGGVLL